MGLYPRELDAMTKWEFEAAWAGFRRFHAAPEEEDQPPPMSEDRLAELGIVGFEDGRRDQ